MIHKAPPPTPHRPTCVCVFVSRNLILWYVIKYVLELCIFFYFPFGTETHVDTLIVILFTTLYFRLMNAGRMQETNNSE